MSYMVAESTKLKDTFSLQATKDIQNGAIVGKGALVSGEKEIYTALDDYSGGMFLALNPAWSYENGAVLQNEEEYVNKSGIAFRAYKLEKDMKFKISNITGTFAVGDTVKYDSTTETYVSDTSAGANLKVVDVEEVGFPYCIGDKGARLSGDTNNDFGYVIGAKTTKYTIEVIK